MSAPSADRDAAPRARDLLSPWDHPGLGRLKSRVVMTAMTRSFAAADHTATPAMAAYYARRPAHGVGLVLTESTAISSSGDGFPAAPRMENAAQADSWRQVTTAVHTAGGRVFSQLLHCGRISHPDYTDGAQPVSATDQRASGINRRNNQPYAVPRRLAANEMPGIYAQFCAAATRALAAGFDGVELHLAHGYLADQFLDARVNDRTDGYGGSIENRCRFALEVIENVLNVCGPARLMVRFSPSRWMDGQYDWPDLGEMIEHLIPAVDRIGLRMLDISCARADYHPTSGRVVRLVRPLWPHFLIAGASLSRDDAQHELDSGLLDMVTYGRSVLANPDLVERLRSGRELRVYDRAMLDVLE